MNTSMVLVRRMGALRQLSTSAAALNAGKSPRDWPLDPAYKKAWSQYAHFQKKDGIPVHLKKGLPDKVLYYGTIALLGYALVMCADFYYHLIWPPKPE